MKLSYILNSLHIKWNNWFFCLNFDDYSLHLMKIKQYRDAYFLFKQDLEPAHSAKTNSKASEGINPDDTLSRAWIDWNTGGWWMGPWLGTTGRCQQGTRVCSIGWESLTLELELHRLGPLTPERGGWEGLAEVLKTSSLAAAKRNPNSTHSACSF